MFDAQSASSLVDLLDEVDNSYEQIKIPYGTGKYFKSIRTHVCVFYGYYLFDMYLL